MRDYDKILKKIHNDISEIGKLSCDISNEGIDYEKRLYTINQKAHDIKNILDKYYLIND